MSVRIGFIGTGGIAVSHLRNLTTVPEAEVVALSDISADAIETAVRRVDTRTSEEADSCRQPLGAVPYTDYRTMLRNERLDAVYLCLPPFVHGAAEEAVIDAGLPMLIEKPVGLQLPRVADILGRIRSADLLVASGYQLRYTSFMDRARSVLDGRTVGMAAVTRFGSTPGLDWYRRQEKSGGQVTEMATHQVDLLRYLIGEIDTVYSAAGLRINGQQPDYDIFDVNCSTFTFRNGAVANFATNFITDRHSPLAGSGLHIFCEGLTLSIGGELQIGSPDGVTQIAAQEDPMATEDRSFVHAVDQGRPDLIRSDYANAVRTLAVTLANDRSARTGEPVKVDRLLEDSGLTAAALGEEH